MTLSNEFNQVSTKSKDKRPTPVSVRLLPEERSRLETDAGDLSLSAYIRLCLFGESIPKKRRKSRQPVKDQQALGKVLGLLGRSNIANNLNQLAKAANTGTLTIDDDTKELLVEACSDVQAMKTAMIEAMGLQA
ncbi:plasmid mobilization relaxosome protein MobC [Parvularcula sp. IMCC14364]|uniref:plasmid mobilization protein n=1 Tax=Parvularcula sp. IMCC14364 TaxID=3067902 RepID=UPI00274278D2|nr:plasmid mobilization relaxosome protein MobC [Parvularcula sp. IMCC14364]